jgi:hypothetical protein
MNRLTAIGLASLVAYGLLLTSKYTGFVSAAREDKGALSADETVGSAVVGRPQGEPEQRTVSLPPPIPRAESMRASPSAVDFRTARDLKAFADSLLAHRDSLTADEQYHLAKALEECAFTTAINEDLAAYSSKQRRQFLGSLVVNDPNNAKRIAAYDSVDNTQRCMRFQGSRISQKDIDETYMSAAQQGDPRAQARILVAEMNAKVANARNSPEPAAQARITPDNFSALIGLLQSRDPEAMMIVGGFLTQNQVAATLHVGPNGEVPEPSAFLGGFSLASCEMADCLATNREAAMACAYGGYCNPTTFDELYQNFMASPWTYMQAMRYRNLVISAIDTHNWSLIGLTPPVANNAKLGQSSGR